MSIGLLLVAILFQIAGAAMLVAGAPPLAVLHAFAAFVVLAIVAASHQLIPVFFRCAPMPPGITLAVSTGFIAGFVLLIDAFCGAPTFAAAGVILGMSTLTWGTMVLWRLIPARAERSTGVAIGLATASFVVAGVLGALAAAAIGRGSSFPVRLPVIHGSLMILAFASVFVVALSYRFVPMFALAHTSEYGNRAWQFVLIAAAIAAAAGLATRMAFGVLSIVMVLVGWQHVRTLRSRLRKRLDASLLFATVAWSFGVAAAILVAILGESERIVPSALALGVLGWLTLTIFGYAMKVAGFLAWQYARSIDPARTLTPLSAAIPIRLSRVALVTLALGVASIALVSALAPSLRDYAAAVYLCGGVLYLTTMLKIVTPYVRRAD